MLRELSVPLGELAAEMPWVPLLDALLLAADGQHEAALVLYDSVLDLPEPELPVPLLASALLGAARCRFALGDRAEAVERAAHARDLLDRWPGYRRDDIDAFLRRAGRVATQDDGDLTAREKEVAALVAQGLTNAAIAKQLYISPRTAAVHVSNVLAKLGLSNRSELTAWALRSGLVAGGEPRGE